MEIFHVNFDNNILVHSEDQKDYVVVSEDQVKVENSVIINMVWKPDNLWEKILWSLLKHSFKRKFFKHFDIAEEFYSKNG